MTGERPVANSSAFDAGAALRRHASRWRFVACVQGLDFLLFFVLSLVWFKTVADQTAPYWWLRHIVVSVLAAAMMHCVFQAFRIYEFATLARGHDATLRALAAGFVSFGPFLAPLLLRKDIADGSAASATGLVAAGLVGIAALRFGIARLALKLQKSGFIGRRIYIIAADLNAGRSLQSQLERRPDNNVVGTWDLSTSHSEIEVGLQGALEFLQHNPVDVVILKLPLSQTDRLVGAARVLRTLPRTVLLAPSLDAGEEIMLRPGRAAPDSLEEMVLVKLSDRPLAGWRWILKDLQDRTLAILLTVIMSPVMLAIMVAIKLSDPGPAFFLQERRGYGGKTFRIIKFRSMTVDASASDPLSFRQAKRNDPRVFPVGRFLRKTSLDELPQLLNVLMGDMWIIGPRPHPLLAQAGGIEFPRAVQEYAARYRIKPGITGWAQVSGWRGPTDTLEQLSKRVEHDLYYIENWSSAFDAMILFKTLFCAFGQENAF